MDSRQQGPPEHQKPLLTDEDITCKTADPMPRLWHAMLGRGALEWHACWLPTSRNGMQKYRACSTELQ
jgi:hypothetical protein